MNRLTELVLDTNELYSNFSESETQFLTDISFALQKKITKELSTENRLVYNSILLNKIWDEYIQQIIYNGLDEETDRDTLIGYFSEPVELDYWVNNCIGRNPNVIDYIEDSTKYFINFLDIIRNDPSDILKVLKTFKDIFMQIDSLYDFHTDLNKIFDLSGLMFNDNLTRENHYLRKNIHINQIFEQIGFKELFSTINFNGNKEARFFAFQNLTANYFLFMNLLIYMDKRTPSLFENTTIEDGFDLHKWQLDFDGWSDSVNNLVDSIAGTPYINEDQKKEIIAILEETDFGMLETYDGIYFEIDENNKYEDAKKYVDCLNFLNLFASNSSIINKYYEIYHTLQSIIGIDPSIAYNWHGEKITYKKPIDVYIWKNHYGKYREINRVIRETYPLYMINNPYMRENIIITSKEVLTEINYDWEQMLFLTSPLSVTEKNIGNLAFVKELLRHDFLQFRELPAEIKQNKEIKDIALKQAFNFLSNNPNVNDDFFSSQEFIKGELGIDD